MNITPTIVDQRSIILCPLDHSEGGGESSLNIFKSLKWEINEETGSILSKHSR